MSLFNSLCDLPKEESSKHVLKRCKSTPTFNTLSTTKHLVFEQYQSEIIDEMHEMPYKNESNSNPLLPILQSKGVQSPNCTRSSSSPALLVKSSTKVVTKSANRAKAGYYQHLPSLEIITPHESNLPVNNESEEKLRCKEKNRGPPVQVT